MKANKIIEMSQEKSRQKVKLAMEEIQRMRNEGERITVSGLCKRTGLSNSFFYRNEKIKEEVHKACCFAYGCLKIRPRICSTSTEDVLLANEANI